MYAATKHSEYKGQVYGMASLMIINLLPEDSENAWYIINKVGYIYVRRKLTTVNILHDM